MIFGEINKHEAIARILGGENPRALNRKCKKDPNIFGIMNKHEAIARILGGENQRALN